MEEVEVIVEIVEVIQIKFYKSNILFTSKINIILNKIKLSIFK